MCYARSMKHFFSTLWELLDSCLLAMGLILALSWPLLLLFFNKP